MGRRWGTWRYTCSHCPQVFAQSGVGAQGIGTVAWDAQIHVGGRIARSKYVLMAGGTMKNIHHRETL